MTSIYKILTKHNTMPAQKHTQKDGSNNAISPKTSQNLKASTSNTYIRVFEDAQNPCQNHHKIDPKIIKNPTKIDPWTHPGSLLEQRSLLRPLISPFLAPKGSPMGPQNRSKIDHFLNIILVPFLEPLFHAFGLHLGSQNDPKKRPQRDPRPEHENHRFCYYLLHFSHIQGS